MRRSCSARMDAVSARARTSVRWSWAFRSSASRAMSELMRPWARASWSSNLRAVRRRSRSFTAASCATKATVIPPAAVAVLVPGRRPNPTQAATAARPTSTASTTSARRRMRSKATASKVAAATPAATAKTICVIVTSPMASGYAEQDERECHADGGGGERPQCPLRFGGESLSGDGDRRAVDQLDAAGHLSHATSNETHGRGQAPLRMTEEGGERGGEHGLDANGLGGREVGGQDRKGPPGQREPRVAVKAPA